MEEKIKQASAKLVEEFYKQQPNAKILFLCIAGSHFFNLNTEKSDLDFRGIYLPSPQDIFSKTYEKQVSLNTKDRHEKKKNTNDDIDCTFYSIDEFLNLLSCGDFNMLELLYTPTDKIIQTSQEFQNLQELKQTFNPIDLSSFIGFVKKELKVYALESNSFERLSALKQFLETKNLDSVIQSYWSDVEEWCKKNKYAKITTVPINKNNQSIPAIEIASRIFIGTDRTRVLIRRLDGLLEKFGHRKKMQAENKMDYKGVSHAFRLLYEAESLIDKDMLELPFPSEKEQFLKKVKNQEISLEEIEPIFMDKLNKVQLCNEHRIFVNSDDSERYSKHLKEKCERIGQAMLKNQLFSHINLVDFKHK
jgi:predicted nucleotidyltransferase